MMAGTIVTRASTCPNPQAFSSSPYMLWYSFLSDWTMKIWDAVNVIKQANMAISDMNLVLACEIAREMASAVLEAS